MNYLNYSDKESQLKISLHRNHRNVTYSNKQIKNLIVMKQKLTSSIAFILKV